MSSCDSHQLAREWSASVRTLEDVLREPVTVASVPGGGYSRRVAAAAASAGVLTLFTSEPVTRTNEVDGCTVAGRFTLRTGTPTARVARFAAADRSSRVREWMYWNTKKLAKIAGGTAYLRVRRWMHGSEHQ